MFKGHPSTFAKIIGLIHSMRDPADPDAAATARPEVERLLSERFREEADAPETGPFRRDYARARLDGAVDMLDDTRRRAVLARACPDFLALIDLVAAEARAAFAKASARASSRGAAGGAPDDEGSRTAAWPTAELPPAPSPYDLLPQEFKDL